MKITKKSTLWDIGILELQNRVTQNEVTNRVINSKSLTEILFSS